MLSRDWYVLVLDEAHYVKNEDTDRYDLLDQLTYDYAFFLIAPPIQNDVMDLYNVISLLRPGLFGTREGFNKYFVESGQDTLINSDELQRRSDEVMIRNRREETDIDFTPRNVTTRTVDLFDPDAMGLASLDKLLKRLLCLSISASITYSDLLNQLNNLRLEQLWKRCASVSMVAVYPRPL